MRTMAGNIRADGSVLEVQIEGPLFTVYKVAETGKIIMQLLRRNRIYSFYAIINRCAVESIVLVATDASLQLTA